MFRGVSRIAGIRGVVSTRASSLSSSLSRSSPVSALVPRRFVHELTDAEQRATVFQPKPWTEIQEELEREYSALDKQEELKNQSEWYRFHQSKYDALIIVVSLLGIGVVYYYWQKEKNHFLHHRHQQEPYPYFMDRTQNVATGFWPGRSCQFMEFNCYAATYAAADQLLAEKHAEERGHDDEENKH